MTTKQTIALVILAVIILGGLLWVSSHKTEESGNYASSTPATTTDSTMPAPGPNGMARPNGDIVAMSDQKPGKEVTVDVATIAAGGFVEIHQDNNGTPGAIIGMSKFIKGESDALSITLTRASKTGETLYAMLHVDDGGGTFDMNKDMPDKDADGNIIMQAFKIDPNATVQVHVNL